MDPNYLNTPPAPAPSAGPDNPEYLNVIADNSNKNRFLSGRMLIVIISAVVVLVLVIIIAIVANNARQAAQSEIKALNSKLGDLQSVIRYSRDNLLNNSNTVKVVAETNLISLSHQSKLIEVYAWDDGIYSTESPTTSNLDEAKAIGNLDDVYITVLREQLLSVCKQLELLYDSAKTDDEKDALNKAYADFEELSKRLPNLATN